MQVKDMKLMLKAPRAKKSLTLKNDILLQVLLSIPTCAATLRHCGQRGRRCRHGITLDPYVASMVPYII